MSIVHWMSLNAARMVFDRSPRTSMCTDGGSCASSAGSSLRGRVGDLDGVHAGLPLERQVDGALPAVVRVEPRGVHRVLDAVDDVGDLLEAHGLALAVGRR